MNKNIGKVDRALRIVGGLIIIMIGTSYNSWFGLIGLVPLLTGLFSFCPLYSIFNVNTNK